MVLLYDQRLICCEFLKFVKFWTLIFGKRGRLRFWFRFPLYLARSSTVSVAIWRPIRRNGALLGGPLFCVSACCRPCLRVVFQDSKWQAAPVMLHFATLNAYYSKTNRVIAPIFSRGCYLRMLDYEFKLFL